MYSLWLCKSSAEGMFMLRVSNFVPACKHSIWPGWRFCSSQLHKGTAYIGRDNTSVPAQHSAVGPCGVATSFNCMRHGLQFWQAYLSKMSNRPLLQSKASGLRRCCPTGIAKQRLYTVASTAAVAGERRSKANIDWDSLGFGLKDVAGTMYVSEWTPEKGWDAGKLVPYGPMTVMPSAQVLNYGQSIFEGMKAQESAKGHVVCFRPDQNAARFKAGAARMSMPAVPEDQFVEAVKSTIASNLDYVPPIGKGSLYLRPLLLGTGPILGLGPAPSYTFTIFAAAVGAYFKGGQLSPIDLIVEERFHRAAPGGMGGTKAAGNYSPVLVTQLEAKKNGFADVVYLDAKTDTYLEEVSSCNIFMVKGRTIKTPPLQGTILPGVTRRSIIELARSRGYDVFEEPVSIHEAMEADEIFTTGTAVVVSSVGSMTFRGQRKQYTEPGQPGAVALEMYKNLTDIQTEQAEDKFGWVVPIN